jgi:hypothetical protein
LQFGQNGSYSDIGILHRPQDMNEDTKH